MAHKQLIHSVTAKDCKFTFTKGSGKGGQKRNKTSNACHCLHIDSGARGYADNTRSAHTNRRLAFLRMTKTQEFNEWHVRTLAQLSNMCDPKDLKVEIGV